MIRKSALTIFLLLSLAASAYPQGLWVENRGGQCLHMNGHVDVIVNENLFMDSFRKPLVAQYTKGFAGGSIILTLFSGWTLLRMRKTDMGDDYSKSTQQNP